MKRILRLGTIILALLGLGVLPALGQDWYVDGARGDDNNPPANVHSGFAVAFRTIGQAVAAAAAGDVIQINSGTYPEYVYVTKNLTLNGVGNVIIDGNMRYRSGFQFYIVGNATVKNIQFQNCAQGIILSSTTLTVENCRFNDNSQGIYLGYSSTLTVRDSLFNNNNYGYYGYGANTSTPYFWHCTFTDNDIGAYGHWSYDLGYYQYCLFANNSYAIYDREARPPYKVQYCDFWENTNGNYPVLPAGTSFEPNYALDPQFVSRATRNYYLGAASPLNELRIKDENGQLATIGAFKSAFVSNNTVDNWADWKDDQGASLASSPKVAVIAEGVTLQSGVTAAAIVSPVYDSGNAAAKLVRVQYRGIEFEREAPGYKSYIDYDPATPEQEIRYRIGNNAGSLGAWQTTTAHAPLNITGRYYQLELVLRNMQ